MSRDQLEQMLAGKTVERADLSRGTVRLFFTDGTRFEREKTFEGLITATLFDAKGNTLATVRI